ncbi:MAG: D-glycerate dehydrogenase [Ignavibacteriales bacterium]|nr:D-glycerate dehydrogenase [Ignavibacteriales bacterium]
MKVFSTYHLPAELKARFKEHNIDYSENPHNRSLTTSEIISDTSDADGIITLLSDNINREVISSLTKCKIIANYAVGYNNIDLVAAREKSIIVTNTPGILTDATAEITFALIFACARRVKEGEEMVREGKFMGWKPELLLGRGLSGKNIGIIGAGRIGQAVAKIATGFNMNVYYHSRIKKVEMENNFHAVYLNLRDLMMNSDIISLHIPLTPETNGLVSKEMLDLMKPDAIIINTARGEVIDEDHLITMLKNKKILAAGFDVYKNEPNINPELFDLDNVVLLPHLGSATVETRAGMAILAADNVIAVLTGKLPLTQIS